ncbi:MAG TPA: sulfotransferase [Roseiarcus sp.]|nr:sulfotransferase [Roseiarcus sp.]
MPLEIIGPGFGRTGTNSLKIALELLGFGPSHHMFEVRDNPEQLPNWEAAARGEKVDWDDVFRGYRSQVDFPGARYWRELAQHYPDAKVILTVRDPDAWFDSVEATILPFLAARGKHSTPHVNAIAEMGYRTVALQVFDDRLSDRDHAIRVFRRHIAEVQSEIPADRLLTFDVSEGWEPLSEFLGVDAPDVPFPKTNSSKAFVEDEWKQE